jgi:tetratricopeptide (TPR) repeat protein
MSDKKKVSSAITDRNMSNSPSSLRNAKKEGLRPSASRDGTAAVPGETPPHQQLSNFEAASRLFHARKFQEARDLFLLAAAGPERDVAHRAKLHAEMCSQRLGQPEIQCKTAEDHYNYGVALLNSRRVPEACSYLERALQLSPDSDHIHYALAVAHSLGGDPNRSHQHLKRAIELEPKNRLIARQDTDLAGIVTQPQFQALLYPEKKSW